MMNEKLNELMLSKKTVRVYGFFPDDPIAYVSVTGKVIEFDDGTVSVWDHGGNQINFDTTAIRGIEVLPDEPTLIRIGAIG